MIWPSPVTKNPVPDFAVWGSCCEAFGAGAGDGGGVGLVGLVTPPAAVPTSLTSTALIRSEPLPVSSKFVPQRNPGPPPRLKTGRPSRADFRASPMKSASKPRWISSPRRSASKVVSSSGVSVASPQVARMACAGPGLASGVNIRAGCPKPFDMRAISRSTSPGLKKAGVIASVMKTNPVCAGVK